MKHTERDWFRRVPWETVLATNQSFCDTQQTAHQLRAEACQRARQVWQGAESSRLALPEAIDICRQCYDFGPFIFNNGNTFAAVARKLIEDWLQLLPPVEAQIARTTVGHYVVGQITRKEMVDVLTCFESKWKINGVAQPMLNTVDEPTPTPAPIRELRPQAEARISRLA